MRAALGILLLSLALATGGWAAPRIGVVFEYPRSVGASGFVITVAIEGQPTPITMGVTASAPGACAAVGEPASPDIYCAWLGCFPGGSRLGITAQAKVGDQLSGPSNVGGCIVDQQCTCVGIPGSGSPIDVLTTPGVAAATPPPIVIPDPVTASIPPRPVFATIPTPPPAPAGAT
jgi:hypothetical protein